MPPGQQTPIPANLVRAIIDRKLADARDIARACGRSRRTVLRWMSAETEPALSDVLAMLGKLPAARSFVVDWLTAQLEDHHAALRLAPEDVPAFRLTGLRLLADAQFAISEVTRNLSVMLETETLPAAGQLDTHRALLSKAIRSCELGRAMGRALRDFVDS